MNAWVTAFEGGDDVRTYNVKPRMQMLTHSNEELQTLHDMDLQYLNAGNNFCVNNVQNIYHLRPLSSLETLYYMQQHQS